MFSKQILLNCCEEVPLQYCKCHYFRVCTTQEIEKLGGTTELCDMGKQTLPDGTQIPLPPVLLGQLGSDPKKKTVCLYGHLDVQPAKLVRKFNFY